MSQGSSSARWDQHPQRLEQEKAQPWTPSPAMRIPWVTSPLSLPFPPFPGAAIPTPPLKNCCHQLLHEQHYANPHHYMVL